MGGSNSAQVQGSISCAVHPQGLGVFRHLFVEAFLFYQKPPKSACSSPQPQHRTGFLAASRACTAAHFYPCSAMRSGVAKQRRLLATHFARGETGVCLWEGCRASDDFPFPGSLSWWKDRLLPKAANISLQVFATATASNWLLVASRNCTGAHFYLRTVISCRHDRLLRGSNEIFRGFLYITHGVALVWRTRGESCTQRAPSNKK